MIENIAKHRLEELDNNDMLTIKVDFFDILLRAPNEIAGLRKALVEGRINGSSYIGECSCLIGTIANIKGCEIDAIGNGIAPYKSRPSEIWFTVIYVGDDPSNNQASRITVEWIDEFLELIKTHK